AVAPTAVLNSPVLLSKSAAPPTAVFSSAVLKRSAPAPVAVLKLPAALLKSEYQPTAVFAEPVVRFLSALVPSAVVKLGYPPSGGGTTACAGCKNAKPASRQISTKERVFVFICADSASFALHTATAK